MFRNALPELYQILNQGIDYEQVSRSLETALDNYIAQSGAVVLGYEFADVGNVFSRYFSKSAPFGDGKRKHEFPDAFAIQMVEHWCRAENARAYVITSDKAIKEVCESNEFVQHLERIDQFLDISNRQDTAIAELVDRYIEDHPDEISDLAAEKFEELSFYVEDEDGSVDGVSVSTALCLSYSILSYTSTNVRVFTEFQIEYASHISYPDPDFTWYDSETGRVHHLEYLSEEVLRIEWVECEFVLGIDQDSGIGIGARDLIVISPKSIGVTTEQQEEAASNYK
jgi:hypothetical protein